MDAAAELKNPPQRLLGIARRFLACLGDKPAAAMTARRVEEDSVYSFWAPPADSDRPDGIERHYDARKVHVVPKSKMIERRILIRTIADLVIGIHCLPTSRTVRRS